MSAITVNDVKRLAQLSALQVSDTEADELRVQLEAILDYVKQLDEVDTNGVEPTYQVTGLENVTREDVVKDYGVTREDLLRNAPDTEDGQIKVKKVL
jgi:aspartyl-tRNA(Asn)/glutamyl-tRNA(Gln) amidotransferase subunit C